MKFYELFYKTKCGLEKYDLLKSRKACTQSLDFTGLSFRISKGFRHKKKVEKTQVKAE